MTTELVKKEESIFKLFDREDEKQIVNLNDFTKGSVLVYKVQSHIELSYKGIKYISILMADRGMPLTIVGSKIELMGDGKEKTWYASVVMRNEKTKQEAEGISQCPFYDSNSIPDQFARTKAHSKAERNAIRKLIPEYMITKFIDGAMKEGQVKNLGDFCSCLNPKPNPSAKEICTSCNKVIRK